MEHERCAQCRNPIRGRQAAVRHARSSMSFHADCWAELAAEVQQEYLRTVADHGIVGLLSPYSRTQLASWLPQQAIDVEAEELADRLADELADGTVGEARRTDRTAGGEGP